MRKIRDWFFNAKIRTKMLISYILIFLAVVLTVCFLLFFYTTRIYREQLLYSASQSFGQAQEFLNYRIDSVLYVSDLLRVDEDVQKVLGKKKEDIEGDIIGQNTDMMTLEKYIYSICNSVDIYQISLYLPGYLMYSEQEVLFRNLDEFEQTEAYGRLEESGESGIWLPPQELHSADTKKSVQVISFLHRIQDISQLGRTVGIERVSIRSQDIAAMMEKSNITSSGIVWIENDRGELISCSDEERYERIESGLREMRDKSHFSKEWEKKEIAGEVYFVRGTGLEKTDWKLIAALPEDELYKAINELRKPLVLVLFVLTAFVAVIAVLISNMITSPISRLAAKMELIGDTIPHLEEEQESANDEIGQLYQSFRYMSNRLEELMDREYENGKAVKHAELRALQAQINPHFLYNTLDLINWEALDCGAKRITKISRALAKFYKLSLNKGKEFSKVRDELEHVRYYIMIQNFRYDDRLKLTEDVSEALMEYEVLHIVLQPLAENAFVHGMAGKSETAVLQLGIHGYEEGEDLVLEVADNGCGMSEEQMRDILNEEKTTGYGVCNIHTRIRLVYGESYGLEYLPNEWGGVTVRLRFPKKGGELS